MDVSSTEWDRLPEEVAQDILLIVIGGPFEAETERRAKKKDKQLSYSFSFFACDGDPWDGEEHMLSDNDDPCVSLDLRHLRARDWVRRHGAGLMAFVVCRFVCRRWLYSLDALLAREKERAPHLHHCFTASVRLRRQFGWRAAAAGKLNLLEWAVDNGCPLVAKVCSEAARRGHLHVLKWARQRGCPWDHRTLDEARGSGNDALLKYLRDNGCPEPPCRVPRPPSRRRRKSKRVTGGARTTSPLASLN